MRNETTRRIRWLYLPIVAVLCNTYSHGAEIGPTDKLEAAVATLEPGAELVLRGGLYVLDEHVSLTASGTAAQPITIRAKAGETPVIKQANPRRNVVEIRGSSYLILRGIEFTGGSHGIRLVNSDFITIEDCEIHETGDVAISANAGGTYEGLKVLRNHIHHTNGTGEGVYFGCNNDRCRVINSLIAGNYIHHTNRETVTQGDGIEIKEGSYGNVIRDNVIHDTKYPGIILYSTVGNGPANTIEGNVVWNVFDNAIQIAADAVVRNNIVLGNISFRSHQSGRPSNIEFVHNTIINSGAGIEVRNVSGPILIANNAVYSQSRAIRLISGDLDQIHMAGNVGAGGVSGSSSGYSDGNGIRKDLVTGNYGAPPSIDAFPSPGSALIRAGDESYVTATDFNGNPRDGVADAGAYKFDIDGNTGWAITSEFKLSSSETE